MPSAMSRPEPVADVEHGTRKRSRSSDRGFLDSNGPVAKAGRCFTLCQIIFLIAILVIFIIVIIEAVKIKNDVEEKVRFISAQVGEVAADVKVKCFYRPYLGVALGVLDASGNKPAVGDKVGAAVKGAVSAVESGGQGAVATITSAFGAIPSAIGNIPNPFDKRDE
ncbi:hypothetical protein HK097_002530 [Rhizophlyctis rosea]|uniref:Uncharacterized protein n=1 Tax=Rhizophlyctis rosea TaxID=64517 RepID=A0AAD5SIG3_9FUNG|nr:hypothetical protein HK097_002530 [Rhizophlyctis rosea]